MAVAERCVEESHSDGTVAGVGSDRARETLAEICQILRCVIHPCGDQQAVDRDKLLAADHVVLDVDEGHVRETRELMPSDSSSVLETIAQALELHRALALERLSPRSSSLIRHHSSMFRCNKDCGNEASR